MYNSDYNIPEKWAQSDENAKKATKIIWRMDSLQFKEKNWRL